MKAIVTGFEPFGRFRQNPSWEAVKLISERPGKNILVHKMLLPVEYDRCADLLWEAVLLFSPDVVLCTGAAARAGARRSAITPEYVAVNIKDSATPDNNGKVSIFETIVDEGESALYTNLPITDVLDAIHSAGVPAAPSFDAGTYVCNNLFYRLMFQIRQSGRRLYGGFLHLPSEEAVASRDAARALEAVLLMLADKPPAKPHTLRGKP